MVGSVKSRRGLVRASSAGGGLPGVRHAVPGKGSHLGGHRRRTPSEGLPFALSEPRPAFRERGEGPMEGLVMPGPPAWTLTRMVSAWTAPGTVAAASAHRAREVPALGLNAATNGACTRGAPLQTARLGAQGVGGKARSSGQALLVGQRKK